ncbi:helix-turn-helix transcriptional regulator [Streptococcus anginosus]|uniref:helix-turn-helix transcriptional regulator n=1 Tax=Streptococcus anginosus TaxID=1328 RepID=UPI0021F84CAE|nr:helix-turn-helix transcriptional regulator [Streptococcus anginosus]MCW1057156.1 helix-turn-helix domain-containing protein [Streptococcus anginosus]MED5861316.1 helix-turn-helix transcriptional regulator [Streptococcus anginosus]MED5961354.1 helix-turn-helix transcriptional regulator [Streptococcus anginosus]WEA87529.1 helix-turn-helix transcriptional regulator [Streptococcus anginosus]WEB14432.1 helix-turn-helix transcriptional regulator [Streptococcus anginosus]
MTLKAARAQADLTQEQIAQKMGIARNTYNDYENYRTFMRIDKAVEFSEIVSIPFDNIIFLNKNYT